MNKIVRRFMSGVSLAALSFGVPTFARAGTTLSGTYTSTVDLSTLIKGEVYVAPGAKLEHGLINSGGIENNGGDHEVGILVDDTEPGYIGYLPDGNVIENEHSIGVDATGYHESHVTGVGIEVEPGAVLDRSQFYNGAIENDVGAFIGVLVTAAHDRYLHANGVGVEISTDAYFINRGEVGVTAGASHGEYVHANVTGVREHAWGEDYIYNTVANSGDIGVYAYVKYGRDVRAQATDISQFGGDAEYGRNAVDNTAYGYIHAYAQASLAEDAAATAEGVEQRMFEVEYAAPFTPETGYYGNHIANFTNGEITASAYAHNAYSVHAHAVGASQQLVEVEGGVNSAANSGLIAAHARAISAENAQATATGINQRVHDFDGGDFGANTVYNYESGHIVGSAYASSYHGGHAGGYGVVQSVDPVDDAYNSVYNYGRIAGRATDHGITGSAVADAGGVFQSAADNDYGHNAVRNGYSTSAYGTAHIVAEARAYDEFGRAEASAVAVGQVVEVAEEASNFVSNYYGHIYAHAAAIGEISAHATAYGVNQFIYDAGDAYNSVYNHDEIVADAYANANDARAQAVGVNQRVQDFYTADNFVANVSGDIHAHAFAEDQPPGSANAYATGVTQHAKGSDYGRAVNNTVYNYGIDGHGEIYADAGAIGYHANAYAEGVSQAASTLYSHAHATNIVVNGGQSDLEEDSALIEAHAFASGYTAHASAGGVSQTVSFGGGGKSEYGGAGHNIVYNTAFDVSSDEGIRAHAFARGDVDGGYANATAVGIGQNVSGGNVGTNYVYSSGPITAYAVARAGVTAEARAKGIDQALGGQYSSTTGTTHDHHKYSETAYNFVYNHDGLIVADAVAGGSGQTLYGSVYATANHAVAHADGIKQSIIGDVYAYNDVWNTGRIYASAYAYAVNDADAHAKGINQVLENDQGTRYAYAGNYAYNYFDGQIAAYASAVATTSDGSHGFAEAEGIEQRNTGAHYAENYAENYFGGAIYASAYARGSAARASAFDIDQRLDATLYGYNDAYNSSYMNAHGEAAGDHATAYGVGIFQSNHAEYVSNYAFNDGGYIGARATAYGDSFATAYAAGIAQYAVDGKTGFAYNYANNSGTIEAHAYASANSVSAIAFGIGQYAEGYHASNSAYNHGLIEATAYATGSATALAIGFGIGQIAIAEGPDVTAYNFVSNAEGADIDVHATAYGSTEAVAIAAGIIQAGVGDYAYNTVYNAGEVSAYAEAAATDTAIAVGVGIGQVAFADGYAQNSAVNSGTIGAHAHATGYVLGVAGAVGVLQAAIATSEYGSARNAFYNNGGNVNATATAYAGSDAIAIGAGVLQIGFGADYVSNYAVNGGFIHAHADASGYISGIAAAIGVLQAGIAGTEYGRVHNSFENNGGNVTATATADATNAIAVAAGVAQIGLAEDVVNYVENSGYIYANANAHAETATDSSAHANAYAIGVLQYGAARSEYNQVVNDAAGVIGARANATATGYNAEAHALAAGVVQAYDAADAHAIVSNYGHISAYAFARADATGGTGLADAKADAAGIYVGSPGVLGLPLGEATTLHVQIVNDGYIYAQATAEKTGAGSNTAHAYGIAVENSQYRAGEGKVVGLIDNEVAGHITAEAYAPGGKATAVGIGVEAKQFGATAEAADQATIENFGYIDAQAFARTGYRFAIGIAVESNGYVAGVADVVGHIINDGGFIYASEGATPGKDVSNDDGEIGAAIDVRKAPNEIDISLEGNSQMGELFGSIFDSENAANWTNKITVSNGITYLDGSINPGLGALANGGTLTLGGASSGGAGTLWLPNISTSFWANNGYVGNPSNPVLNVKTYTQTQYGTLMLDVDGSSNVGSINAVTASLNGAVVVNPVPWSYKQSTMVTGPGAWSLFPDTQTYDVVTTTGGVSGTWTDSTKVTSTTAGGAGSPLLDWAASYTTDTADITLTRVKFNAVAGLTPNEAAVGLGLEHAYEYYGFNVAPTGPSYTAGNSKVTTNVANEGMLLFASLFQLAPTGPAGVGYAATLASLSDEEAGELAKVNVVDATTFSNTIAARLDSLASVFGNGGEVAPAGQGWTLWGTGYGSWTHLSTTVSGAGFNHDSGGVTVGVDASVDPSLIVGIAGSLSTKENVTFANGNYGSTDGYEVGLYGRYTTPADEGGYYLQGNADYGAYTDRTQRFVRLPLYDTSITPMAVPPSPAKGLLPPYSNNAPGASGWLGGAYTEDVWSIYAEGGYPWLTGDDVNVTPYVAFGYNDGTSGSYNETGKINMHTGPALAVSDVSSESAVSYLGVQFSSKLDMEDSDSLLPSLRVAWAHEFEKDQWKVNAAFDGLGTPSTFTVNGSALAQDSAVIDAEISAMLDDGLMGTLGYEANINNTLTTQTVFGRLDIKF